LYVASSSFQLRFSCLYGQFARGAPSFQERWNGCLLHKKLVCRATRHMSVLLAFQEGQRSAVAVAAAWYDALQQC
jgi:hypothetical protein